MDFPKLLAVLFHRGKGEGSLIDTVQNKKFTPNSDFWRLLPEENSIREIDPQTAPLWLRSNDPTAAIEYIKNAFEIHATEPETLCFVVNDLLIFPYCKISSTKSSEIALNLGVEMVNTQMRPLYSGGLTEIITDLPNYEPPESLALLFSSHNRCHVPVEKTVVLEYKDDEDIFLNMLSDERASNYHDWMDVGASLYSEGDVGLEKWRRFSARGPYADLCDDVWESFIDTHNTRDTIEYFVYVDDPIAYNMLKEEERELAFEAALERQTHDSVATLFKACYPFGFLCSNFDNQIWYAYDGIRWRPGGICDISRKIKREFVPYINEKRQQLTAQFAELIDVDDRKRFNAMIAGVTKLIIKLETNAFQNGLIRSLRTEYMKRDFDLIKDTIPHFTAFANGIVDVRSGNGVVRDGKPEDFITKRSRLKIEYDKRCVDEARKYMNEVFTDPEKREFMYRFLSSFLFARNSDKIIATFCGIGNNSKSIFVKIFGRILDEYHGTIGTSILTERRSKSDSANAGLIRITHKRTAVIQEPDDQDQIRSGTLKELSGGDNYPARDLFERGAEAKSHIPTFIPIIVTNHKLRAYNADQAFWNRVVQVKFDSHWVEKDYPETYEEQLKQGVFPMDRNFEQLLPVIAKGLGWIMVNEYHNYHAGLRIPACVQDSTDELKAINNIYSGFMQECIEASEGGSLRIKDAYDGFKTWYSENGLAPSTRPTMRDFGEAFSVELRQEPVDSTWTGICLIYNAI